VTALLCGAALFVVAGLIAAFLPRRLQGGIFTAISIAAAILVIVPSVEVIGGGSPMSAALHLSMPVGTVVLRLDRLAAFFAIIIAAGGALTALYSAGYLDAYRENPKYSTAAYYLFLGMLESSMLLVTISRNMLFFLGSWELMTIASTCLVLFEHDRREVRRAGVYYFAAMQVGAAFLMVAFGWAAISTGTLDFDGLGSLLTHDRAAAIVILALLFVGFGTKAGLVPLHTWLPRAHPAAPAPVSAIMSGVMIKTGIYGMLRMVTEVGNPGLAFSAIVVVVAVATALLGIMNAAGQNDLKRVLAYSSVENSGIIALGIGIAMVGQATGNSFMMAAGYLGALLHTLNHFTFKMSLFFGAGMVYSRTHELNMERLGGLVHRMRGTALFFLIASLAICGLPALNGFTGEFAVYLGLTSGTGSGSLAVSLVALLGLAGLALVGAAALLVFTRLYGIVFQGAPRSRAAAQLRDISRGGRALMTAATATVTALVIALGAGVQLVLPALSGVVGELGTKGRTGSLSAPLAQIGSAFSDMNDVVLMFAGIVAALLGVRLLLLRGRSVARAKTWNCGYQGSIERAQYTAGSFAAPFLSLVEPFVPLSRRITPVETPFPTGASIDDQRSDASERLVTGPLISSVRWILSLFRWVQSGRTQHYILYGMVFLIVLVALVFGGL